MNQFVHGDHGRLTSLGVIGALVKHPHPNVVPNSTSCIIPDSEVTEFLVKTEAIPLCLHIMEYGNELSQTVATFIIQKILLDDYGLNYVCKTSDRFFAISCVLTKMIQVKEGLVVKFKIFSDWNIVARTNRSLG